MEQESSWICPQCSHQNASNKLTCEECGNQFPDTSSSNRMATREEARLIGRVSASVTDPTKCVINDDLESLGCNRILGNLQETIKGDQLVRKSKLTEKFNYKVFPVFVNTNYSGFTNPDQIIKRGLTVNYKCNSLDYSIPLIDMSAVVEIGLKARESTTGYSFTDINVQVTYSSDADPAYERAAGMLYDSMADTEDTRCTLEFTIVKGSELIEGASLTFS